MSQRKSPFAMVKESKGQVNFLHYGELPPYFDL